MGRTFQWLFRGLDEAAAYGRLKLLLLSSCFFFVIASYSIIKPLKTSVFNSLVGIDYLPMTKYLTIILMIPAMFLYSSLVDRVRRYQVAYFFFSLYALLCLLFAYFLMHPAYGLTNTFQSKYRVLGWAFYVLMDFFPIFIVSTFWAFTNSVNSPDSAKDDYGYIVSASKIAGITSPLVGWSLINMTGWTKTGTIPLLVGICSVLLILAAVMMLQLIRRVPGKYLHGYEAVYQLEKERKKETAKRGGMRGFFDGFKLMITQPYLFGIFGLVYSYEIISALLDYQMQFMAVAQYKNDIGDIASFNLLYTSAFQGLGLFFAFFGTRKLLKRLDVQICLVSVPVLVSVLLLGLKAFPTLVGVSIAMVFLRALNYGFNVPIREILYIPTIKDVKFKSKAWIDSFGRTFSKTSGATINLMAMGHGPTACFATGINVSLVIVVVWMLISVGVSRRYMDVVRSGSAIGDEE